MDTKDIVSTEDLGVLSLIESLRSIELPAKPEPTEVERYFSNREQKIIEARLRSAAKRRKELTRRKYVRPGKTLKPDGRTVAGRTKAHWATIRKKERTYYKEVEYYRNWRYKEQVVANEGWYTIVTNSWKGYGWDVQVTREEWDTHVEPVLREMGAVPFTKRYYVKDKAVRLDNIMIYSKESKEPIFDGAEWKMRNDGYIL